MIMLNENKNMQLLEAPTVNQSLLAPPSDDIGHAVDTVRLAANLTPEPKRILTEVVNRNARVAEAAAYTADSLGPRLH